MFTKDPMKAIRAYNNAKTPRAEARAAKKLARQPENRPASPAVLSRVFVGARPTSR